MVTIPEEFQDLVERPLFAQLATVRPDGTPQVNPMWFEWDGERIRFSHVAGRQKYRNIAENPHVAISIPDPEDGYRYIELRGVVENVVPDIDHVVINRMAVHYGRESQMPRPDQSVTGRVVITVLVDYAKGWSSTSRDPKAAGHSREANPGFPKEQGRAATLTQKRPRSRGAAGGPPSGAPRPDRLTVET